MVGQVFCVGVTDSSTVCLLSLYPCQDSLPYSKAIEHLQKLPTLHHPAPKLESLVSLYRLIVECIKDYYVEHGAERESVDTAMWDFPALTPTYHRCWCIWYLVSVLYLQWGRWHTSHIDLHHHQDSSPPASLRVCSDGRLHSWEVCVPANTDWVADNPLVTCVLAALQWERKVFVSLPLGLPSSIFVVCLLVNMSTSLNKDRLELKPMYYL